MDYEHGAEYALDSVTGAQIVRVGDYPAVQTSSNVGGADPDKQCILYVDTAPGQSLVARFVTLTENYPGMNHQVACQMASRAAEMMVATLRAQQAGGR